MGSDEIEGLVLIEWFDAERASISRSDVVGYLSENRAAAMAPLLGSFSRVWGGKGRI